MLHAAPEPDRPRSANANFQGVQFVLAAPAEAGDAIEVFDPGGRSVGVVRVAPGDRVVRWDWRDGPHRAGVYLARLRSGSEAVRFVILR